jgi:hypothetical protein
VTDDSPGTAELDPITRRLLVWGLPTNAIGALIFAPPFPWVRDLFGLPGGHALYLWILSIWILIFGIAYSWMGLTGRIDRTFLAVGACGKATFSLVLIAMARSGEIPVLAAVIGLPDLALAAWFAWWLVRNRSQ